MSVTKEGRVAKRAASAWAADDVEGDDTGGATPPGGSDVVLDVAGLRAPTAMCRCCTASRSRCWPAKQSASSANNGVGKTTFLKALIGLVAGDRRPHLDRRHRR
jgi:hypothetical protein